MIANCELCELLVTSRKNIVNGYGPDVPKAIVVGEAPGDYANETGMPLTYSVSGKLMRQMLKDAGVDPTEVYYTNAVKCMPPRDDGKRRKPFPNEIDNCRKLLLEELASLDCTKVISAGSVAAQSLLGSKISVLEKKGQIIYTNKKNILILPHPVYYLRNRPQIPEVKNFIMELMKK